MRDRCLLTIVAASPARLEVPPFGRRGVSQRRPCRSASRSRTAMSSTPPANRASRVARAASTRPRAIRQSSSEKDGPGGMFPPAWSTLDARPSMPRLRHVRTGTARISTTEQDVDHQEPRQGATLIYPCASRRTRAVPRTQSGQPGRARRRSDEQSSRVAVSRRRVAALAGGSLVPRLAAVPFGGSPALLVVQSALLRCLGRAGGTAHLGDLECRGDHRCRRFVTASRFCNWERWAAETQAQSTCRVESGCQPRQEAGSLRVGWGRAAGHIPPELDPGGGGVDVLAPWATRAAGLIPKLGTGDGQLRRDPQQ